MKLRIGHACFSVIASCILLGGIATEAFAAKCLYVSSYHKGYEWQDGIERGIESTLKGKCDMDRFYMDTKRHPDDAFGEKTALDAKAYIESTKPDIVIACDDPASKYLVVPYFKNASLPFVFCGINWTVEPYGYPFTNVTGMIEISPIQKLVEQTGKILGKVKHATFLASDDISQHKEAELNREIYKKAGITISPVFVKTMGEWEAEFKKAQKDKLLVLGNNAAIKGWDAVEAKRIIGAYSRAFSVTNYDWMAPYAMLSLTKVAEEQGEWSAKTALTILRGKNPKSIPIIVNQRTNIFVNPALLKSAGIKLPPYLMQKGIKVGEPD